MRWLKTSAVILGAMAVTSLAIDAADTLTGTHGSLLGQLVATESDRCPTGMTAVPAAQSFSCVDTYEAAPGPDCPYQDPQNQSQTQANLHADRCQAVSEAGARPWRFVTREQASTACLRAGKRLITSAEWFMVAAGTPETGACNVDSTGVREADADTACTSALGVADTTGNVWEWTADDVIDGQYQGRAAPESGYVTQVDAEGFPTLTSSESSGVFFDDYFWSDPAGAYGLLRGGFYASQSDAGIYAVHAKTPPTRAGEAIGFRCVR